MAWLRVGGKEGRPSSPPTPSQADLYSSTPLQADTIATTTMATTPQMQHPPSTPNTIYPPWYHHSAAGMLNLGCWAAPAHQTPTIK